MAEVISNSFLETVYSDFVAYLKANSGAKYFGMSADWTRVAKFPFANLQMAGRPTGESDLENNEVTIRLTFQTTCLVNSEKMTTLYGMDDACGAFFHEHGFRRSGDSVLVRLSDSVNAVASRFTCDNFNGEF